MARLIDADALCREIERIYDEHYCNSSYQFVHDFFRAILRRIGRVPTVDAVPVVRCKDCKFIHDKGHCTLVTGMTRIKPDDYCSHGERRTDVNENLR